MSLDSGAVSSEIGVIISSSLARRIVYGVYVIAALVIGCIQTVFSSLGEKDPTWETVALTVIGYLALPIGGLAIANAKPVPVGVITSSVPDPNVPVQVVPIVDDTADQTDAGSVPTTEG